MGRARVIFVVVTVLVVAVMAGWLILRKTGPQRVAAALSGVGCDLEGGIVEPSPDPDLQRLRGTKRTASLSCGAAAVAVGWVQFDGRDELRSALDRMSPRYPSCVFGDQVVIAEDVLERDFRDMCRDLNGKIVPTGAHWTNYDARS